MNIDESIIEFKKMIERDKDTLRYWKSDTFGHYEDAIKKLEKDVLISETLLTAYEKEKEKNKKSEEKIKKYINKIQKELDKYKIKNTNTYIQIEGNPEINGLLIQKATLEELIKEE